MWESAEIGRQSMRSLLAYGPFLDKRVGRAQAPRQATAERPFRRAAAVEPPPTLWHTPAARCRSSVVEHPLGKGEVHSSILCGSTIAHHHLRDDAPIRLKACA